jgi:hypothetical protein
VSHVVTDPRLESHCRPPRDPSVRNAQRWEDELGLPVHHLGRSNSASVYALPEELERWHRQQDPVVTSAPADEQAPPAPPWPSRHRTRRIALFLAGVSAIAAAASWLAYGRRGDAAAPVPAAPVPVGVVVQDVKVAGESARLGVANGQAFRLRMGDGRTYGFSPSIRPGENLLAASTITTDATSGADRVLEVARLPLTRRLAVGPLPVPVALEIVWDSVLDERTAGFAQASCCVSCDDLTLCALTVQSPCGRCSAAPPVSTTPAAGSRGAPIR